MYLKKLGTQKKQTGQGLMEVNNPIKQLYTDMENPLKLSFLKS